MAREPRAQVCSEIAWHADTCGCSRAERGITSRRFSVTGKGRVQLRRGMRLRLCVCHAATGGSAQKPLGQASQPGLWEVSVFLCLFSHFGGSHAYFQLKIANVLLFLFPHCLITPELQLSASKCFRRPRPTSDDRG